MPRYVIWLLVASTGLLAGCPVNHPRAPFPHLHEVDGSTGAEYYMYVPSTYTEDTPMPVVVTCHGTIPFDTANMHVREWEKLAEDRKFIVVAPVLVGTDGILGAGVPAAMLENEERILSIIKSLSFRYNIDRANVVITGFSGGGFPTYFVGLRHPDIFNVVVAGGCNFNRINLDGWYADRAKRIPILVYWGRHDPLPITIQSRNAVEYLSKNGFKVSTAEIPGIGHERRPEMALDFLRRHWRTPRPSLSPSQRLR